MNQKTIDAIMAILAKGDRVELIPLKDKKLRVVRIRREPITTE